MRSKNNPLLILLLLTFFKVSIYSKEFIEFHPEKQIIPLKFKGYKFDTKYENPPCFKISSKYCIFQTYIVSPNEKENDRKLFLIKMNKTEKKISYVSTGSGDNYSMNPYFFKVKNNSNRILILCELGTEYSWGFRVFLFENNQMKDIGDLDIAKNVDESKDDSALRSLKILEYKNGIKFQFRGNLNLYPGEADRLKPIGSAIFLFNGKRIKLLYSH